jgi:hypothetical protein
MAGVGAAPAYCLPPLHVVPPFSRLALRQRSEEKGSKGERLSAHPVGDVWAKRMRALSDFSRTIIFGNHPSKVDQM